MYGTKWVLMFLNSKVLLLFPLNGKVLTHLAFFGNSTFNRTVRLIESTEYFANQPPWNSTTVPRLLQMSHPNGKLSRMSPTAIFSCILLWKNMRKKPPDKYYPPLRYYLALVIVCTVLMYCKQIKAVGNTKGERGTIRPPPPLSVQMDFMWTFEANTKCNNINHVWSQCYKFLVVLKYHRRPWVNIFVTDISRRINIYIKVVYLAFFGIFMLVIMSASKILAYGYLWYF